MVAVALALTSCNRQTIYSHYEPVSIDGWERNDTLMFDVERVAEAAIYTVEAGVRVSDAYPYANLALVIRRQASPEGTLLTDTIHIVVTDADGYPLGSGINHYQHTVRLTDMKLQAGDSLHAEISHLMSDRLLPGVTDVGLTVRQQ